MKSFLLVILLTLAIASAQNTTITEPAAPACPATSGMSLDEFMSVFLPIGFVAALGPVALIVVEIYKRFKKTGKVSINPHEVTTLVQTALTTIQQQQKEERARRRELRSKNKDKDKDSKKRKAADSDSEDEE